MYIYIQPDPDKMKLEMVIGMQSEILHGQSSGLFSNEPFKKRPVMTIEDFVLHSNDLFESRLLGIGLYIYTYIYIYIYWITEIYTYIKCI